MRRLLCSFAQKAPDSPRSVAAIHDVYDDRLRPKSEWASFAEIEFRTPDPFVSMVEFLTDGRTIATLTNKPCRCHVHGRAAASSRGADLPVFPLIALAGIFFAMLDRDCNKSQHYRTVHPD